MGIDDPSVHIAAAVPEHIRRFISPERTP